MLKIVQSVAATRMYKGLKGERAEDSSAESLDFANLFSNLLITGIAYLIIPVIVCLMCASNKNKFAKKQVITIIAVNSILVYAIFAAINYSNTGSFAANVTAAWIWSFVAYFLMKKVCMCKEKEKNAPAKDEKHITETYDLFNVSSDDNTDSTKTEGIVAMKLYERLHDYAVEASEQFLSYLQEDSYLYGRFIGIDSLKITSAIFVVNLYREMLKKRYGEEFAFTTTQATISCLSPDEDSKVLYMQSLEEYTEACQEWVKLGKDRPDFDFIDTLTKLYFSLVIDDREYLMEELEDSISRSVSYKKIYNYVSGILNDSSIIDKHIGISTLMHNTNVKLKKSISLK